jgi:Sigma-70 region 2
MTDASVTIRLPAVRDTNNKNASSTIVASGIGGDLQAEILDEVLVAQLCEGSGEALAILFRRYARTVRSIAYRAVRNSAEADDPVNDMFLLVHRDSKAFDSAKGSARAWILQIADRRAIFRHRYLSSLISITGWTWMT